MATATPQINHLIGWVKKTKRANPATRTTAIKLLMSVQSYSELFFDVAVTDVFSPITLTSKSTTHLKNSRQKIKHGIKKSKTFEDIFELQARLLFLRQVTPPFYIELISFSFVFNKLKCNLGQLCPLFV